MFDKKRSSILSCIIVVLLASALTSFGAGARHFLNGNIPEAAAHLKAMGDLPATNQMRLSIALPLRNQAELTELLRQIYDPASANYHKYLTPAQFTEKFGPTKDDYQAVINFVKSKNLRVTQTYANRVVLDVAGSVAQVENAFETKIHVYKHPKEARTFFAPDAEPSVEAGMTVPILSISGLDNYSLPKPASLHLNQPDQPTQTGSGTGGTYAGLDFRAAYVPGTKLDGTGQSVALVEFDGYYSNDIAAYEKFFKLPYTTLNNVPVNGGASSNPGTGTGVVEVSLDIEMAVSMATNLSSVLVYQAPYNYEPGFLSILSQIANDDLAAQISCSWYVPLPNGVPNTACEQVFQQMAAQGQSFFTASGDYDAFTGAIPFPDDSPSITTVGGTTLTSNKPIGIWLAETVWNAGGGEGSSGGVSTYYPIPSWQEGINSFLTNAGSTVARNVPDVALTADNIYVYYGNGSKEAVVGTSCAAPLWAGFMALVNQQAVTASKPLVGFINPAIYEIANESIYLSAFHDITKGSNTWSSSPSAFFAVSNYDLCTGLGSPKGTNLINALVNPDPLIVVSNAGFNFFGTPAGTFNAASAIYYLTNTSASPLAWSVANAPAWLSISNSSGTLPPGGSDSVVVGLNMVASNLLAGTYSASLWFSNVTSRVGHSRFFTLTPADPLVVLPQNILFNGPSGGPFAANVPAVVLTNASANSLNWSINNTSVWFNISPASGFLAAGTQASLSVTPTPAVANLTDGSYTANFFLTNLTSQYVQLITGVISVGIVKNGGFETGDFTGWTLAGNTYVDGTLYDGVVSASSLTDGSGPEFIHSGTYGAFLGDTNLAYLSQTIATVPGHNYLLSFWLANPITGSGQEFLVNWNTNSAATNQIYYISSPGVFGWRNVTFLVGATGTNATLQFGAQNPTSGFGLDDVSMTAVYPPAFTSQPTNVTVLAGGTAVFSAAASGSAPLAFQWQDNFVNLTNGGNVAGATTGSLTLTGVTAGSAGNYAVVITNAYGSATSSVATLTVVLPPVISGVVENHDGTVTLNLAGSSGLSYILESATNLTPPINWQPVATNVFDQTGTWQFTDTQATNFSQQFYRLEYTQ